MARFHINSKGEPGVCRAQAGGCPFGGEDAHYATPEAASKAYEATMATESLAPAVRKRGLKELNELAKTSGEPEDMAEILRHGSDRTLKNLAKNPNVPSHVLLSATARTEDQATREALEAHPSFPVQAMLPETFVKLAKAGDFTTRDRLMSADGVKDEHIDAIEASNANKGRWEQSVSINSALANPNNQLSQAKIVELGSKSWNNMGAAQRSGRFPADEVKNLPESSVYWGNISHADAAMSHGYAEWCATHKDSVEKHKVEYNAGQVARNANTEDRTLALLAQNDLALVEVYKHPNASEETKAMCAAKSEEVGRVAKLAKLEERYPEGLRSALTVSDQTNSPFGANRGIRDTVVRFDTKKLAELDLDAQDVYTLMGRGHYNGGSSFDPATGIFRGTVDSTD